MHDSLYMILTSVIYINILHRSFPACNPLWFWIRNPLDGFLCPQLLAMLLESPIPGLNFIY